jgi:hypothetical protein
MHNQGNGRVPVRGVKSVRKALLMPAALAMTVISSACADDEPPALASCSAITDAGGCQVCADTTGKKACAGAQYCALDQVLGICNELVACSTVPEAGTCQACVDTTGKKACAGVAQYCVLNEARATCGFPSLA